MKRILLVLLLSLSFASFTLKNADITISLNKDNSAHITETFTFFVDSEISKSLYNSLLADPNDLAKWSASTGIDELRLHTDRIYGNITNLDIKPQPLSCNPLSNICTAVLILTYDVYPYSGKNDTGIFFYNSYKPRTTRYTLNPNAFSFLRDSSSNIILDEKTRLIFNLPPNSKVIEVNPLTSDISQDDLPAKGISTISWKNKKLVKLTFVFDVEESIVEEIQEFFVLIQSYIVSLFYSPSGILILIMIGVPALTYLYLNYIQRNSKKQKKGGTP